MTTFTVFSILHFLYLFDILSKYLSLKKYKNGPVSYEKNQTCRDLIWKMWKVQTVVRLPVNQNLFSKLKSE